VKTKLLSAKHHTITALWRHKRKAAFRFRPQHYVQGVESH